MTRDILIINFKASILQRSQTDVIYLPIDKSVDASLFYESYWLKLVETPGIDDRFNDSEISYLKSIGMVPDAL